MHLKGWTPEQKLVAIEWVDSRHEGGWKDSDEFDDVLYRILTVGFLVKDGKKVKVVSATVSECGNNCSHMLIPTSCITKMKFITDISYK